MISFFRGGGILNTIPTEHGSIERYIEIVRNNPEIDLINIIRELRLAGNQKFKVRKRNSSYCTPNCFVKRRDLDESVFDTNFIDYSGYFYFDFDVESEEQLKDVKVYKQNFIKKYGDYVSTVAISISGGGITALLKVSIQIGTSEEYNTAWNKIRNTLFISENVDPNACDLGRALFLTHDPEIYVNLDSEIDYYKLTRDSTFIPSIKASITKAKNEKTSLFTEERNNNRLKFTLYEYNDFMKVLKLKTDVEVLNDVVDFKEIEFVEVKFPRIIIDGRKRKAYSGIIHHLVYLNPNIDPSYIYSYLVYLNNIVANPKMEISDLVHLTHMTIKNIKETGKIYFQNKIKRVHFNPKANLHPKIKSGLANQINARYNEIKYGEIILKSKNELLMRKGKITKAELRRVVALEIPKISRPTIDKYIDYQPFSFDDYINGINQIDFNKTENVVQYLKTLPEAFNSFDWLNEGDWE